jgi:hypothetical protein
MPRLLPALALVVAACGAPKRAEMSAPPPDVRPFAAFAAQRVAVMPAQRVRQADTAAWGVQMAPARAYLDTLDATLSAALTERGMGSAWALPADVVRAAKRNAPYAADPHALAVTGLLPRRTAPTDDLAQPLASQLRMLVALTDARYALVPVELRLEKGVGAGRAVLHLALLDARAAQVTWAGDVAGDTASTLSPALAASVAMRVADLIAAP